MKGFKKVLFLGLAIVVFTFLGVIGTNAARREEPTVKEGKQTQTEEGFYEEIPVFTEAITLIRQGYVREVSPKDLIYGALRGMLSSLDPYSQFMDPEEYEEMKVETKGEFGGVGIVITIKDNLLTVVSPIEDTPAFKAGIKAGDVIVKINGQSTKNITLYDAVDKIRGEPGTEVILTIVREGQKKLLDFTIVRGIIEVRAVKEARLLTDNIGYIRLVVFNEKTDEELEEALDKLEREKADSLILDLRNNPGGLLEAAVEASSKFIRRGKLIVYTQGREKRKMIRFTSKGRRGKNSSIFYTCPLIVLVNEGSASASEIVAGAIQDYHRGILLGTKTFGKGSVQTVLPLSDGSGLRLTTAKYFTPSGRCIQDKGIVPDIISQRANQEKEKDENDDEDKEEIYDPQLQRAIDLLKGIKVYQTSRQ